MIFSSPFFRLTFDFEFFGSCEISFQDLTALSNADSMWQLNLDGVRLKLSYTETKFLNNIIFILNYFDSFMRDISSRNPKTENKKSDISKFSKKIF